MDEVPWQARDQRGVFTRDQARAEGWTTRQIRRRLTTGRWRVVAGAALVGAQTECGAWQLGFAVALSWPGAVISHQLAGSLWGFPIDHEGIGTATVGPQQGRAARGLRAYRTELRAQDVGRIGGLAITTQNRTALDLLATRPGRKRAISGPG